MSDTILARKAREGLERLRGAYGSGPAHCSAADVQIEKVERVKAAWSQVLSLGQKFETLQREERQLLSALREAVEAALRIEKETGVKW